MALNDSAALPGTKAGASKPTRRDAVGAEIPVTVHASRTTQGFGNNLPPVHEDTKTVIVLAEGAVVRMTAALVAGETVVLTNRITGADVLCRVGKVKAQPGIQQYVDLEFTQRAPGFWGDVLAASSAPAVMQPPPAPPVSVATPVATIPLPPPVSIATPVPTPRPLAIPTPIPAAPVAAAPVSFAPVAPAPVPPQVATSVPNVAAAPPPPVLPTPPSPTSLAEPAAAHVHEQLQAAPLAEQAGSSWSSGAGAPSSSFDDSPKRSTMGTMGTLSGNDSSDSAVNNLWKVAAAIALLLIGAGGGYWLFGQKSSAPATVAQAANIRSAQAASPSSSLPLVGAIPADPVPQPVPNLTPTPQAPAPQNDIVLESRATPLREERAARVQPAALAPEPRAVAEKRNAVQIGQMKAPKAKTAPVRMDSNSAAPALVGSLNLGDSALLAAENLAAAAPAAPARPALGGQLQPPQIQSSVPPVYPANARALKLQGAVELDALVDETGKVSETTVVSGPQPLIAAARDAVQKWKYKPAQLNGKPIAVHTRVSVRFNLAQ